MQNLNSSDRSGASIEPLRADSLEQLRARTSAKWQHYPPDVLPLWVAEMDYPLAPVIAETLVARIAASDTGYVAGASTLAPAFADFAQRQWGWNVTPEWVHITTDVSVAIVETLRRLLSPGDAVIITPPVYPPFFELVPEAGGTVREVPLLEDDSTGWMLDLNGIETAFASGAKVLLLCNPHNPLGLVHSSASLAAIADLAERYGARVVSDEIHGPLTHSHATFTPFLSVSDAARDVGVCVTSASKAWNLAGIKCAVMVASSARGEAVFAGMPDEVTYRASILGLHASTAAFTNGSPWLGATIAAIESSRDLLSRLLAERLPAARWRAPEASYLAWIDFRGLDWGDDPSVRALQSARVALNPGPSFGSHGRGFARLNFACSAEVLTEAVDRLAIESSRETHAQ